jgi:Ser/Thr protein kinase RdoA (MazF antagonist)
MRWLATLPRTKPAFGLIHGDFTLMNLRTLPGRVTAFDFDSCCEHWRAYDLACFLHPFGARPDPERAIAYEAFLSGYSELRLLDASLVQQVPRFGKMRLLYSFLVFAREWRFENLTPEQEEYSQVRRRLFSEPPTWPGRAD